MQIRTIVVGQLGANCYLIIDDATRAAAVIDPGDDIDEIARAIQDAGADLKYMLLTHGHPDHSWATGELQRIFDVELSMHEADIPQLEGEPDLVAIFYDADSYIKPRLGKFLKDGDIIKIGETELRVLHTPGHSPGAVCYVSDGIAFTGDTLFAGSVGRTDFSGGSQEDLMRSLRDKLLSLPDDTVIYPGHGPASTIGAERKGNPWIQGL
jgi:glyoxylase-like metal-dependent hydrolase (beta-lactamase superfamily II)